MSTIQTITATITHLCKKEILKMSILCFLGLGVWVQVLRPVPTAGTARGPVVENPQYLVVPAYTYGVDNKSQERMLNELGGQGWRLVQAYDGFLYFVK